MPNKMWLWRNNEKFECSLVEVINVNINAWLTQEKCPHVSCVPDIPRPNH